ncbi:MAG: hypothetical protein HYS38_09855 [Acidobacteria bacterium]|nr:hypothetical protein [Acidobacteriota bacterium]
MKEDEVTMLGNAILSEVTHLSIPRIRAAAAAAGMDAARIPAESEAKGGLGSRAEVEPALFRLFAELPLERKERALPILAERVIAQGKGAGLTKLLGQHGYHYLNGAFVPVGLIDEREARYLPPTATSELAKAISRLSDNDDSGAITAACGAVDATTTALYEKHKLGDPGGASFQTKVNTVLNRLGIIAKLEKELTEIGVQRGDAHKIAEEVHEATKHAAEALQVIRRTNGDVHGTKPTYTRIVYDTIKWSSAICGLLEGE